MHVKAGSRTKVGAIQNVKRFSWNGVVAPRNGSAAAAGRARNERVWISIVRRGSRGTGIRQEEQNRSQRLAQGIAISCRRVEMVSINSFGRIMT
nr:uncharacterized protein CTRU02_00945 [Colletotrichum truncatum]KAF6800540.1 hypothetical protein CTRU02_00945 [Colletotrichum truncatum]